MIILCRLHHTCWLLYFNFQMIVPVFVRKCIKHWTSINQEWLPTQLPVDSHEHMCLISVNRLRLAILQLSFFFRLPFLFIQNSWTFFPVLFVNFTVNGCLSSLEYKASKFITKQWLEFKIQCNAGGAAHPLTNQSLSSLCTISTGVYKMKTSHWVCIKFSLCIKCKPHTRNWVHVLHS